MKHFDPARARATARRICANIELAKLGEPLVMPKPLIAVSLVPNAPEHVIITNIGTGR